MVEPLPEDEFAEIPVVGYEDALLIAGDGKHFVVFERVRMVVRDGGDIVSHHFENGG
jgi:hypothetical protein